MTQENQALVSVDSLAGTFLNFDVGEFASQVEEATKPQAPRRGEENAGKVNINMTKGGGKFQWVKPEEVNVPEEERTGLDVAKKLTCFVMSSNFRMLNWPAGSKRPACSSVGYMTTPTGAAAPVVKDGDPMCPMKNKWDFIKTYNIQAMRNDTILDTETGRETTSSMPYSCQRCMDENQDDWFKKCNEVGRIEILVTHRNATKLEKPFVAYINVTKASAQAYDEYLKKITKKYGVKVPFQLVTDLEIDTRETTAGTKYYVLKFSEVAPTSGEQQALISSIYAELESLKGSKQLEAPKAEQSADAPAEAEGGSKKPKRF